MILDRRRRYFPKRHSFAACTYSPFFFHSDCVTHNVCMCESFPVVPHVLFRPPVYYCCLLSFPRHPSLPSFVFRPADHNQPHHRDNMSFTWSSRPTNCAATPRKQWMRWHNNAITSFFSMFVFRLLALSALRSRFQCRSFFLKGFLPLFRLRHATHKRQPSPPETVRVQVVPWRSRRSIFACSSCAYNFVVFNSGGLEWTESCSRFKPDGLPHGLSSKNCGTRCCSNK